MRSSKTKMHISFTDQKYMMLFFFGALYSISTVSSYTASWMPTAVLFIIAGIFACLSIAKKRILIVSYTMMLWLIVILICAVGCVRTMFFRDLGFYSVSGLILFSSKWIDDDLGCNCLQIMIVGSVVFLIGVVIQLFAPSFYDSWIFPLFQEEGRRDVIRQYYRHRMYTGFGSETAICAQFMILGLVCLYSMATKKSKQWRIIAALLGTLLMIGIVLTGKRSSLLFLIASLLYTLLVAVPRSKKVKRILKILLGTVFFAIILFIALPKIVDISTSRNAIVRIVEYNSSDADISNGRFRLWANAWIAFQQHPFFGNGWSWHFLNYGAGVHNTYLQLLCECGIIGGSFVICTMFYFFLCCHRNMRKAIKSENPDKIAIGKFCMFSQTYILLYCMTGNPLYNYSFLLWYILSISLVTAGLLN